MNTQYRGLEELARKSISGERFAHSVRTAETASALCARFGIDPLLGAQAGIAHDIGRDTEPETLLREAEANGRPLSPAEAEKPMLLHGWYGAVLVARSFPGTDPAVLEAIEFHTAGKPGMGALAMVLFCADYIEPGRKHIDDAFRWRLEDVRLEEMVLAVLDHHLAHLRAAGRRIVKESLLLYDNLKRG